MSWITPYTLVRRCAGNAARSLAVGSVLCLALVVFAPDSRTTSAEDLGGSSITSTTSDPSTPTVPPQDLSGTTVPLLESPTTTTTEPEKLPRVLLVGDSTMAGLRWYRLGSTFLSGAEYTVDVESCRSVGGRSCWGRENRRPTTAIEVIKAAKGSFDVVVLMAGTHNKGKIIESELIQVKKLTSKMGAKLVIVNLRDFAWKVSSTSRGPRTPAQINEIIERVADPRREVDVYVADWKGFSKGRTNWFRRDGIHPNLRGVLALQWYVSRVVAHTLLRPCSPGETETCPVPVPADSLRDWLKYYEVEYTNEHCYQDGPKRVKRCGPDRRMP